MTRDATRRPTTAELIAALHEIPKTDRDYRRALLVIDRLGTHEAELAAERAKSADLEAACEAVVAKYDTLYESMDSDYAAFFTALDAEVQAARKLTGIELPRKQAERPR